MALYPVIASLSAAASGPITALGESAATSVGAGVFLGGFVAGGLGLVLGKKDAWRDRAAVNGGYIGGAVMIAALLGEKTMR